MKNFLTNARVLWAIILALSGGLVYLISLVNSFAPEMNRLRLENIKQDSIIVFQEIEVVRLKAYKNKHDDELNNIYDIFHDYNRRIKTLEGQ